MGMNDDDGGELNKLAKVWLSAIASSCYCYGLAKVIPKGFLRLLFVLPVIYLFTVLPFHLTSYHLGGVTFFFLTWLGNFKLLLLSFGQGPLTTPIRSNKPLSVGQFACICLLPIKVKAHNPGSSVQKPDLNNGRSGSVLGRYAVFLIKMIVLAAIIKLYERAPEFPTAILLAMYCCHMYLGLETAVAGGAALARATLGVELEPQFNNPYLSTSLQDFWGRRWNLMVPDILRSTVYNPVRYFCSALVGKELAMMSGTIAAFAVSGLMHEWVYYYLTRVSPTWEVTLFFLLQGVCTAIEVKVKKAVTWRLHPLISTPLTIAFVATTGVWLFFPQVLRNQVDKKVINEYAILIKFVTDYFYTTSSA